MNPPRIGSEGVRARYARVQAFLLIWRLLTLAQIPVMLLTCPDRFLSAGYAMIVFTVALAHTLGFAWLASRQSGADSFRLHLCDQAVAVGLLFFAHEATLVYIITFYTYATLFSGPVMTPARIFPPVAVMSLAFLAAASRTPNPFYSDSVLVSDFLVYWLWGFSILGAARILNRVSALELDACLEQQRQDYRRHLHDDLGNTLCGLHFRIQSLKRAGSEEYHRGIAFLTEGYNRATDVLSRLLTSIDELEEQRFGQALRATVRKTESDFSIKVELTLPDDDIRLSPEVRREVLAIAREAIANAAKHAGGGPIAVNARRRRRRLVVSVTDSGTGIDTEALRLRQAEGGAGIRGMQERALLAGGKLTIAGSPSRGTTVVLEVPERRACRLIADSSADGGLYSFLTFLKMAISLLTLVQLPLLEPALRGNLTLWLIGGALVGDGVAGFIWRHRLFAAVRRRPWLLVLEQAVFCVLIYLSWRQQLFLVFEYSPSAALVVSACFLGTFRNIALAAFQGAGLSLGYLLLAASSMTSGETTEEVVTTITANLLIALFAGLMVEFVGSLNRLQVETIAGALARQREQLTHEAHRQLYSLIHNLGLDIDAARDAGAGLSRYGHVGRIEAGSRELKLALRRIMNAIDRREDASRDLNAA